jgi:heavy metal sensor kinase
LKRLPIHVRLTAWYLLSLALIITLFAISSWYAMKASMYHSIDRDLSYRMQAVVPFIKSHSLDTPESFKKTFANSSDSSVVGVFVQITDAAPHVLYESDVLSSHRVPVFPRGSPDGSISRTTVNERGWAVRVASRRITVNGVELTVHVVEPLRDLLSALHELTLYFVLLVSAALLLTAVTGYWISRRALAPVEQIRQEAEAIAPTNLTARLKEPRIDDELRRLAQTLNSMLSRIEAGFRSVQQFTADASHELRAPLAFIITAGDVSLRRPRSREELAAALSKIVTEARRMSKLVEDLLALARGDAQPLSVTEENSDLTALLRDVTDRLAPAAAMKGLQLQATLPNDAVQVCGAASDLRRLFLILVDNAIKYTDNGTIRVALELEEDRVKIDVSDTGIGIEPSSLPHIFDRFWRADKVRSRAEGGVGLGLALATQIVQRHHGSIAVESVAGEGSSFIVRLRRHEGTQEAILSESFQIDRR